jgi:hypothetical protein
VHSSAMRLSASVLRITSQPMPLVSPCVIPILSLLSDMFESL